MRIEINESDEKLAEMVAEEIGQELDETGRLLAERVSVAAQPLLEKAMLAAVQHVAVSMVYGVLMGRPHPACESDMAKWRAAERLVGAAEEPSPNRQPERKELAETVPAPAAAQEGAQAVAPAPAEEVDNA